MAVQRAALSSRRRVSEDFVNKRVLEIFEAVEEIEDVFSANQGLNASGLSCGCAPSAQPWVQVSPVCWLQPVFGSRCQSMWQVAFSFESDLSEHAVVVDMVLPFCLGHIMAVFFLKSNTKEITFF